MAQADFTNLVTTTLQNYRSSLIDVVFKATPFSYKLEKMGKVSEDGGTSIVQPLEYAENETFQSYSGYDELNMQQREFMGASEWGWKQIAIAIGVSGRERLINAGSRTKVINLVQTKISNAEKSFRKQFEAQLLADGGTADSVNSKGESTEKDFHGLAHLIGQNAREVGRIDPSKAGNEWWKTTIKTVAAKSGKLNPTIENIEDTKLDISDSGQESVDMIFTTREVWQTYYNQFLDSTRRTDELMATGGYNNLLHVDTPVCYSNTLRPFPSDYHVTSLQGKHPMYFLNMDYLQLVCHSTRWLQQTSWKEPVNQDAQYKFLMSMGNFVITNRQWQALVGYAGTK